MADRKGYFAFEMTGIVKQSGNVAGRRQTLVKTTHEKFLSSLEYFNKNRFAVMMQEGSKITDPAVEQMMRKRHEERYKKENLHIEVLVPDAQNPIPQVIKSKWNATCAEKHSTGKTSINDNSWIFFSDSNNEIVNGRTIE